MSFRPFYEPPSERIVSVSFVLKLSAFALDVVCLCLWLLPDEIPDHLVPERNQMELLFYYMTVPGYIVVLGGLVWLYLGREPPPLNTQRVFLTCGFSLFIITGTFGLTNYCRDEFYNDCQYTLATSLICVCVGVILLVDFLRNEHFFKVLPPSASGGQVTTGETNDPQVL